MGLESSIPPLCVGSRTQARPKEFFRHVAVCVDGSALSEGTIPHAVAMARAFGADLSLVRVLEPQHVYDGASDPLAWHLASLQTVDYLDRLVARTNASLSANRDHGVQSDLLEGDAPRQIRRWIEEHAVDLVVICTHGSKGPSEWPLASTAHKLLEGLRCSMLVVPASAAEATSRMDLRYARVLLPLDGSLWSESALPFAAHLADVYDASLILAHAVPCPDLTRAGAVPPTSDDLDLERRLTARNERIGRDYLDQLRARLSATGLHVSSVLESDVTVGGALQHASARTEPDLIVLPAWGASGPDSRPCGAVAHNVLSHASKPVLLLRPPTGTVGVDPWCDMRNAAARPPTQASQ
ncbi:MAG: universal stress protein [Thioalkalivibrio sp.]|nr:universal stress protein [Thioalkalivibrio sp.]